MIRLAFTSEITTALAFFQKSSRTVLFGILPFALATSMLSSCAAQDSVPSGAESPQSGNAASLPQSVQAQSGAETAASLPSDGTQSDDAQSADVQMSGRFEVGADGKLLRKKSTPMPKPPEFSENMDFETQQGIREFTRYFFAALSYTRETQDLSTLGKISTTECNWCAMEVGRTHLAKISQGWAEDLHFEVTELHEPFKPEVTVPVWKYHVSIKISPHTAYDGFEVTEYPEETLERVAYARHEEAEWRMIGVYTVKKD